MANYATLAKKQIEAAKEFGRRRNLLSQSSKKNDRLAAALEFGPRRSIHRTLVGELAWHNASTGQRTLFELFHELDSGEGKFSVYVNGERWRNGWSPTRFCRWLSRKIDRIKDNLE